MNYNELQESKKGTRYLIKRPKALQWFHNDRLVKHSEEEREAGRFELFLDLLYVALVASFSDDFAENPTGAGLAKYILVFIPAWHIWSDLREIMNSYYTDDLLQRLIILWVMALLVLYANNACLADRQLSAMRTAAGAYVCARFTTGSVFLIASFASYQHRVQARIMTCSLFTGLLFTIPLFMSSVATKSKTAAITAMVIFSEVSWALTLSPWIKRKLRLTFSTAVDIAHEIDRMAAFFIIILGEFVYSVVVGDPAGIGLTSGYGKAVATLVIAFCLNVLYVAGDGSLQATHPIRRSAWTAFGFFILHLPLSMSFLIGGHISAISVRLQVFEEGQKWLLGGGLGTGMFCLWVYGMLFRCEDDGNLIMPRWLRIGLRLAAALALILLPVVEELSDTTYMVCSCMTVFIVVLLWETVGGLMKGACVMESWSERHPPKDNEDDLERLIRGNNTYHGRSENAPLLGSNDNSAAGVQIAGIGRVSLGAECLVEQSVIVYFCSSLSLGFLVVG